MTWFRVHDEVAVVQHNPTTSKPLEGGQVMHGYVTGANAIFARVETEFGHEYTFHQDSGWRPWSPDQWRLCRLCEQCEEPITGEPVIQPAGPGPEHIFCSESCEDTHSEQAHELQTRGSW